MHVSLPNPSSGQPMLLAFAGGPRGREVGMTDEQVVASTLASLRQIYGDSVPGPVNHRVTRWGADPYSLGRIPMWRWELPKRITMRWRLPSVGWCTLLGKATWSTDPATVNGALLSGHRAAERVLGRPIDLGELLQHVPDS
ncbi:FAD-dependent oxidoreductase [Mycobacterium sp. 134]|uniref:FAD-dependent oxidoreductase n=1 Tax=Mycobacterium sp. 134 TaxID=3400425 RepID=UPI003AACED33